jgi:hypothetical protein
MDQRKDTMIKSLLDISIRTYISMKLNEQTMLMKSNHGTFNDQCPRNVEKITPQTHGLV